MDIFKAAVQMFYMYDTYCRQFIQWLQFGEIKFDPNNPIKANIKVDWCLIDSHDFFTMLNNPAHPHTSTLLTNKQKKNK